MSREAMKQALEALEEPKEHIYKHKRLEAIHTLRQALANEALDRMAENARELGLDYEPADEPVAEVTSETGAEITMSWWHEPALPLGTKLYTRPQPAAQWIGLTDEEIEKCFVITPDQFLKRHIYKRIEQALKEKNNG